MVEFLVWRPEWLLNIPALDADYYQMVVLINQVADTDDSTPLTRRLTALLVHLQQHFVIERDFLRSIQYPELPEHCSDHALALAELIDLQRRVHVTQQTALTVDELQGIKRWFFNHVIAEDRLFASYYRQIQSR